MSFSSENDLLDSEQLQQILQEFYSDDGADEEFRLNTCAFFEKTVEKRRCVEEDPSSVHPSLTNSCLVYSYYFMIKQFQENFVKNLDSESLNLENEDLLNFFVSRWNIFKYGSMKLDFACQSLYVHISRHHQCLMTMIYVLALRFWHLHCSNFTERVTGVVMEMLNKERRGESRHTPIVHDTMRLLLYIPDIIEKDSHYNVRRQEQIELLPGRTLLTEFIYHNNVCKFYRLESMAMLSKYSAAGYIRKVKNILDDECKKCRSVYRMPQQIVDYVQLSLSEIFIGNKKSVLIPEFINAVAASKTSVLEDFFSILETAANSELFDIFSKAFYDSVTLDGKTIMEKRAEEFSMQPELHMATVLQIMRKYTALVRIIFKDNENFKKANEKALSSIMSNSIHSGNKATFEPCKYFAIYCDSMLKKPKADITHSISELSCLFEYLENKYFFEEVFYELLVKSLICSTTINEEYEKDILLFVETFWKASHNFLTKEMIRNMIKDIRISKDLTDKFATEESTHFAEFNNELVVKVLKEEIWPLAQQSVARTLPKCLSIKTDSFSAFHKKNYPHKKLTFLYQISQAEVNTHCFEKTYNFHLNLNQLILLSQFNKAESWSIKQLLEDTRIDQKSFDHVIQNFIEAGILKYRKDDDSNSNTCVIILNLDYENEKDCVSLSELKDGIQEAMETSKKTHDYVISEENKYLSIQAAIVRIMKKELFLNHEELVTRTSAAMKTKFHFTSDMVNKSIDKLIQNEYIGRSQESETHYVYIP